MTEVVNEDVIPTGFTDQLIPTGYTDQLMLDVTSAKGNGATVHTPMTERNTFKVARVLQDYPRQLLTVKELSAWTGLTPIQVSSVTQRFVEERTDVTRPRRGVIVYTPGQGPGLKPRKQQEKTEPRKQEKTEPRKQEKTEPRKQPVESPYMVSVPVPPVAYTSVPGLRTADGRTIVQDQDGVVYSVSALA